MYTKNKFTNGYDLDITVYEFNTETEEFDIKNQKLVNFLPDNTNLTEYRETLTNQIFIPTYQNNLINGTK